MNDPSCLLAKCTLAHRITNPWVCCSRRRSRSGVRQSLAGVVMAAMAAIIIPRMPARIRTAATIIQTAA